MSEHTPSAFPLCKSRTPLIVLGPTLVAVLAGVGIWAFAHLREQSQRHDEARPGTKQLIATVETVTLLVAKKDLRMHTPLGREPEGFFVEKSFPKNSAPKRALTPFDLPKLEGKYFGRDMRKGEPVRPEDVIDNPTRLSPLGGSMGAMWALGISIKNPEAIDRRCEPGSKADIVWTGRTAEMNAVVTKTLLEDVWILAADEETERTSGLVVLVVKVALTPEEHRTVSLAMGTGSLRVVVRAPDEKTSAK